MRFCIRYEHGDKRLTDEIDAHSPQEAVVKFQQINWTRSHPRGDSPRVTSVSVANSPEQADW
jgi:hypothetical protein